VTEKIAKPRKTQSFTDYTAEVVLDAERHVPDCGQGREELAQKGIPDEALLSDAAQASVDRVTISRALKQHDYLRVTRRLVTPQVKPGSAA